MTVTICDYDSLYVNRQTGEGVSQEKFNNDEHTTSGDENSGNRVASGVSVTLAGKIYRRRPGNSEKLSTVSRNREANKGPILNLFFSLHCNSLSLFVSLYHWQWDQYSVNELFPGLHLQLNT